jgi:HK97 family phage prohead protease
MKRTNSGRPLPHLATQIFNTPLLIHPQKADIILRVLGDRIGIRADDWEDYGEDPESEDRKRYCVEDGIACIPIYGTLVKRSCGINAMSGLTSYDSLRADIEEAYTDPNVKGILLDIDSPGGDVSGMFDLSDFIYSIRGEKPIYAVANDSAYSAAYALASAADKVFVSRTGGVGSIGCYMLHVDQSQADKAEGLKYTYIYAGDHKLDGNSHAPLANDAKAKLQNQVDRIRDMFVSLVARNRSVSADAVLATQAGSFYAEESVPLLADQIGSCADAMAAVRAVADGPDDDSEEDPEDAPVPEHPMPMAIALKDGGLASADTGKLVAERIASELSGYAVHAQIQWPDSMLSTAVSELYAGLTERGWADRALSRDGGLRGGIVAIRSAPISDRTADSNVINCCVAPYDSPSMDFGGFKEIFAPGCFRDSLASGDDIRVLFNHKWDCVIGRMSARTAYFYDTPEGLNFDSHPPDAQWARDLLVSMERGDITQGSASFWIQEAHWETRNGQKLRVIDKARLLECSVHSFGMYQTSHSAVQKQIPTAAATTFQQQNETLGARLRLLTI